MIKISQCHIEMLWRHQKENVNTDKVSITKNRSINDLVKLGWLVMGTEEAATYSYLTAAGKVIIQSLIDVTQINANSAESSQ